MAQPKKLSSNHAILDVQKGRKKLADHIKKGGKTPVIIHGTIDDIWGNDDTISIPFCVSVEKIESVEA